MEVIVIIIVVAVISNIVRAAKMQQSGRQHYPTVRMPDMPGFPGANKVPVREVPDAAAGSTPWSQMAGSRGSSTRSFAGERMEAESMPMSYESTSDNYIAGRSITPTVAATTEPIQVLSIDEQKKNHKLDFSESGLLNGIVLSEILGPPKGRRH